MTEQEYLDKIVETEKEHELAKVVLADAKKKWTEAETEVIEKKITLDKLREDLRMYRSITPTLHLEMREQEIERFRQDHPELCEWADQRDKNQP